MGKTRENGEKRTRGKGQRRKKEVQEKRRGWKPTSKRRKRGSKGWDCLGWGGRRGNMHGPTTLARPIASSDHAHCRLINIMFFYRPPHGVLSLHTLLFRRTDTQTPTRASIFSTHSDTQAVPTLTVCESLKGIFSTHACFKRSDTLSTHPETNPHKSSIFCNVRLHTRVSDFKSCVLARLS